MDQHKRTKRIGLHALVIAFVGVVLAPLLSGCNMNKNRGPAPGETVQLPVTTFEIEKEQPSIYEEYRIASGDVLDVLYQARTWQKQDEFRLSTGNVVAVKFVQHQELNEEQRIRPDGTISLPYLGTVEASGKTVQELTEELEERYKGILKAAKPYVVVPEFGNAIRELKEDLHTAPRGLSRLTTVRPDGYATFPMIGDIYVRGLTMAQVNEKLNERYDEMIAGLAVDLFLHEHARRRIYVLGAVDRPGAFSIARETTIVEALALGGSPLPSANMKQVVVMRRTGEKMTGTMVNMKNPLALKQQGKFFTLQPDDIVYVPTRKLTRWSTVAREISDLMLFRGWSFSISYDLDDDGDD